MKKLLALVLALVMTLGLATVGANAAFSDADSIDHAEAVEVMSALGVINGLPDGSFNPTGNVTRAQMAKMITIISLGDVDAAAFVGTATDLTDIDGHWAEGYIKYCYSQGVISGRGNGIFDPDANVTAAEAAKMLLVAIGYNSDVQGYTGSQWAINVARDAQLKGFYSDLSVKSGTVLTRDEAAQMIYNAADATVIVANKTLNSDGTVSTHYVDGNADLLANTFGSKTWVGSFDGNYNTGDTTKKGQIQVTGKLDTATFGSTAADFASDFDIANIGEEVKVIFKDGKAGIANQPDEKDTIYGVYLTGKTSVVKATVADISTTYTTAGKIKVAGTEYKVVTPSATTDVLGVMNFGAAADVTPAAATPAGAKAAFESLADDTGDTVKFVLNSDGEVAKAYVTATTLSYISSVNSEKVTINGVGAIKIADNDVYSGAAKNDVVVVTELYPAGDNHLVKVEKAEILSGEVKGFKGTPNETITLDGTVYKVYDKANMPTTVANKTGVAALAAGDIGEKYDLYMVNGYVGAAVKTSESASNYSLVISSNGGTKGSTFTPLKLELLAADGSKSVVTVDKDSTGTPAVGDIVTYTGTADKALVKIEQAWATGTTSTTAFYNKTSKTIEGTATAADAVLFVQTDNTAVTGVVGGTSAKYKAYSVRDLSAITTTGKNYKLVTKSGKVVAAIIDLQATVGSATTSALYGMVTADNGTVKRDSTAYTSYTMWTNDGEKTVYVKTGTLTKGNLYKYEPTTDNYYDAATSFDNAFTGVGTVAAIKSYNEAEKLITYYTTKSSGTAPSVVWGGETTKAVASDVKVIYVNQKDDKAGEEIGVNEFDDVKDLFNAYVVLKGTSGSDADTVAVIFVETSNEVDCDK